MARGVDILVATPGRLVDHMNHRTIRLDRVEVVVLDEVDRMLDIGFIHAIRRVMSHVPTKRQSLFFSATLPKDIAALAAELLKDPATVKVVPVATTAERVEQRVIHVDQAAKKAVLAKLLGDACGDPGDRVHAHQAPRRPGDPPSPGRRRRGRGDPRQQVAEQARAGAGRLQGRHAPAFWSRPTSPRAASMSTRSATWSISTCRTWPRPTSTASAVPPAPARRAWRSPSATVGARQLARHREPDPPARAGARGRGQPLDGRGGSRDTARRQPPRAAPGSLGSSPRPRRARFLPAPRYARGRRPSGSARCSPYGSAPARPVRRPTLRARSKEIRPQRALPRPIRRGNEMLCYIISPPSLLQHDTRPRPF